MFVAIDPGETTGFVVGEFVEKKHKPVLSLTHLEHFDCLWMLDRVLDDFLDDGAGTVIFEEYKVRDMASNAFRRLFAVEAIGVIRLRIELAPFTVKLVQQSASTAKQRWPDGRLNHYLHNFEIEPENDHERDALRHLLTYLERNGRIACWNGEITVYGELV